MNTKAERRCYETGTCPYHALIEKRTESALPKWVFISAFGSMISLAIIFAGWHVSTLNAYDEKYNANVKEFNRVASENKQLLIKLETKQGIILETLNKIERK